MGFLDGLFSDDPQKQAALAMAFGLFGGAPQGRKNFGADLSHAGLLGMNSYNQARAFQQRQMEEEQQRKMRDIAMQQAQMGLEKQRALSELPKRFNMPGNLTPNDDQGNPMPPAPQGFDFQGYANALPSVDPMAALGLQSQLAQMAAKERVKVGAGETVGTYHNGKFQADYTAPDKPPSGFTRGPNGGLVADRAYVDAQKEIRAAGRPAVDVKVNSFVPASEEAQREFMKSSRATYDQLKQAPVALDSIEKAKALIPQARGFMGPGGEGMLEATKFLNSRLGMNVNTAGVKSAEELRTRIFFNIMDNLKKMDAQPSEMQQKIMADALGRLGTDPNAMPEVLDAFANSIRGKVDLYNQEVSGAVQRGVKYPYDPVIKLAPSGQSAGGLTPAEQQELEALRKRFGRG